MPIRVVYTAEFKKDIEKIRDKKVQERIKKLIQRIIDNPEVGKPLSYDLVGLRSLRVTPFRIIYEYKNNMITLIKFEHREKVYRS